MKFLGMIPNPVEPPPLSPPVHFGIKMSLLAKKIFWAYLMYSFAQVSRTYEELLMRHKIYFGRVFQTTAKLFNRFDNDM